MALQVLTESLRRRALWRRKRMRIIIRSRISLFRDIGRRLRRSSTLRQATPKTDSFLGLTSSGIKALRASLYRKIRFKRNYLKRFLTYLRAFIFKRTHLIWPIHPTD